MEPRVRTPDFVVALATLVAATVLCFVQSTAWVDSVFPGFLVLDNGVVASASLSHWPATAGGEIYQSTLLDVDGRPRDQLHDYVASKAPGEVLHYRFEKNGEIFERAIETRLFEWTDWALLFGTLLLCGIALGAVALSIRYLRGNDAVATGTFFPLWIVALWSITATDLYGPANLFRLHAFCECLLAAAMVHFALAFPTPAEALEKRPSLVWVPYGLAGLLAVANQIGLYDPPVYVATHLVATSVFGLGLIAFIGSQVYRYSHWPTFETRQRIKIVALGAGLALGPQVVLALWSGVTGGEAPQNVMAFTGILFPISIAYAVLRHNLLEVDELLRRTLAYVTFTGAVATICVLGATGFDAVVQTEAASGTATFGAIFGLFAALFLLPLRNLMQRVIDRAFFRTAYDFSRIVEQTSRRLAWAKEIRVISDELAYAANEALHPGWNAFYLRLDRDGELEPFEPAPLPEDARTELLARAALAEQPVETTDGTLAVPFRIEGRCVAVQLLGPRRSGRGYSGDDRRLLQTLANQGVVAVQHALGVEALRMMNAELESRVDQRTRELGEALDALQEKNEQLTYLSTTDPVTGLRNRSFVEQTLQQEFARAQRHGSGLSVLMIDIDHFKQVNDRHGHQAGDAVLRRVGEVIEANLRDSDIGGRFGGEEFLILLIHDPGASDTDGGSRVFAERLRGGLEHEVYEKAGTRFEVTVSIGVARLSPEMPNAEALVAAADEALYRAKANGRNRVEVHRA